MMTSPALPRLLAISDGSAAPPPDAASGETPTLPADLIAWLGQLRAAGPLALQLREKQLDDRALFQLALALRRHLGDALPLVINGRADVALAAGVAGVHLPAAGVPVAALRRRFGSRLWLGCSTHHPDEVAQAAQDGADYVTFGPVFPTPSKAAYGAPPGLDGLRQAAAHGLPVFALGGVCAENLPQVAAAGAYGAAGIRVFQYPETLRSLAASAAACWPAHA